MKQALSLLLLLSFNMLIAQTGFISSNIRLVKDSNITLSPKQNLQQHAWRGEKLNAQILITADKNLATPTVRTSALLSGNGTTISPENISVGYLRYVKTDAFVSGCGYRKPQDFDSSLVADIIDNLPPANLKRGQQQAVWLTVKVPADAAPGTYSGTITVNTGKQIRLSYSLEVANRTLPPPADWAFSLDLWQHPAAIARVHQVALWSKEHYRLMRPYYELLAAAGQKNITTSIVHEPWGHQAYDDFPSLVQWTKKRNGSWQFDFSRFDEYVEFVMSCGINKRINCYSMIPWKMMVTYRDEQLGKDSSFQTTMGSDLYRESWIPMLKDFTAHLKSRGWFQMTSIAMDERPMKDMQTAISMLKGIDPAWRIALAGDYHSEIQQDIFDYCVASRWQFDPAVLQERKAAGKPSTFYTCCVEKYPNGFTFSPSAEHTWIGWYAMAKGFTGYLRWAYNSWPADPLNDSRFTAWPAGDTYQVYPGPLSSIRMEKLIEGIQDYEKIRILQQQWIDEGNSKKLSALKQILAAFEIAKLEHTPADKMVEEAKAALLKLQ